MPQPPNPVARWFQRQRLIAQAGVLFALLLSMVAVATVIGTLGRGRPFQWGSWPELSLSTLGLAGLSVLVVTLDARRREAERRHPARKLSTLEMTAVSLPGVFATATLFSVKHSSGWPKALALAFLVGLAVGLPITLIIRYRRGHRR